MCGLIAILAPDGGFSEATLHRMRDRLEHRGPDGHGSWIGAMGTGKVGLGHRRLSIIDLSVAAGQPMLSADGTQIIIFNGEIYNYLELRDELARLGAAFRTRGDTEVLLAAYSQWGPECLSRLNGMYAFVICDIRTQQLFVARDRFGEKPLFYARLPGGGIAVASEMKALFAHPDLRAAVNDSVLAEYTAGRYHEDGEETLFRGVRRIPPATAMLIDRHGQISRQWRYWIPDYTAIRDDYCEDEAAKKFRGMLEQSVRLRLRSDVPIGTSLSGGLDSSALVGVLAELREKHTSFTQKSFSARFDDDPTISEGPEIDRVVRHAGIRNFSVVPDPRRLIEESERLHWHQEEPFLSASIYLQWCVARLARENDTTVLIDGQGADELLAGYQYYFKSFQLDLLDRHAYLAAISETVAFNHRLHRASRAYKDSSRRFNARVAFSLPQLLALALRPAPGVYSGPYEVGVPQAKPRWRLRRQIAEALQYNSLPQLLRYADRNSMAFSREVRLPFLDYELTDWCISLPDSLLIRDGWQKSILRHAADGVIPPEIQWRADKVGYAAPMDIWMRRELKDWCYDRLFAGPILDAQGYSEPTLRQWWDAHQSGAANNSWALWRWISLNEWFTLLASGIWERGMN